MPLLTLEYFSHLHALLSSNTLYALNSEELYEWSAMELFEEPDLGLPIVIASLPGEIFNPLKMERPGGPHA